MTLYRFWQENEINGFLRNLRALFLKTCNTHNPNHAGTSDRVKPIPNPCHDWQGLSDSFTLLSSASLSDSFTKSLSDSFTKLLSRSHSLKQFIISMSTPKSTAGNVSFLRRGPSLGETWLFRNQFWPARSNNFVLKFDTKWRGARAVSKKTKSRSHLVSLACQQPHVRLQPKLLRNTPRF